MSLIQHLMKLTTIYTLANCYSALYHPRTSKWYSQEMVKVAVCYRKALAMIDSVDASPNTIKLKSMICTNLANHLSSQGRALCCIELYDEAIRLDNNPVAFVSKARNELLSQILSMIQDIENTITILLLSF